jgi:hypothetical protein
MAGLVPAIPMIVHCAILIEIAGTSPTMTLERFPVIWKRVGWAKRSVPTKGRALVGTARKSAPLPTYT